MLLLLNMTNLSNAPGIIAASPSRADPTFRAIDASTPANVLTAANGPAAANSLFSDRLWQFTTELTQANAHTFASTSRAASRSVTYVILSLMFSNTSIIKTKFLLSFYSHLLLQDIAALTLESDPMSATFLTAADRSLGRRLSPVISDAMILTFLGKIRTNYSPPKNNTLKQHLSSFRMNRSSPQSPLNGILPSSPTTSDSEADVPPSPPTTPPTRQQASVDGYYSIPLAPYSQHIDRSQPYSPHASAPVARQHRPWSVPEFPSCYNFPYPLAARQSYGTSFSINFH